MQIPGNAGSFPFERALLLQALEPAMKFSFLHHKNCDNDRNHETYAGKQHEPPRLPEMPRDAQVQSRFAFAPKSVGVTRGHAKLIIPRGQITIKCRASRSCLDPI